MEKTLNDIVRQDIFSLMGLGEIPQDEKDRLVEMAQETIMNRVLIRIADLLSEDDLIQFRTLVEEDKGQEMADFLAERKVDIQQIASMETLAYKSEMTTMSETLKQNEKPIERQE